MLLLIEEIDKIGATRMDIDDENNGEHEDENDEDDNKEAL